MKTKYFKLLAITLVLISCSKENNVKQEERIIVGGLYMPYTQIVQNSIKTSINISDSVYIFNELEAYYYSYKPTTNQNIFTLTFSDTLGSFSKQVSIDIFTQFVKPEDFFKKNVLSIDSIMLTRSGFRENFFKTNAILTWDTAFFENFSFKGKGYLELIDTLKSIYEPSKYYPKQRINFEFK